MSVRIFATGVADAWLVLFIYGHLGLEPSLLFANKSAKRLIDLVIPKSFTLKPKLPASRREYTVRVTSELASLNLIFHRNASVALALLCLFLLSPKANAQLRAETYVPDGQGSFVGIVQDPTNPHRQFLLNQYNRDAGHKINVVEDGVLKPTPFLANIWVTGDEGGLLGLAFAPDYAVSGNFYVCSVANGTLVRRFTRSLLDPSIADPNSEKYILTTNAGDFHNGGNIQFGDDGYLYIGLGDHGATHFAQVITNNLAAKMLRIDPNRDDFPSDPLQNYGIPASNPFVGKVGDDEIWAFGLRNPWRWSIDLKSHLGTGGLWIGDVGSSFREEIDYQPSGSSGQNFGWSAMEGFLPTIFGGVNKDYPVLTPPLFDYDRTIGGCIIGGFVYRGVELGPEYWGRYFYGDFISHKIWSVAVSYDALGQVTVSDRIDHTDSLGGTEGVGWLLSFGEDANGEWFYANYGVRRIRAYQRVWMTDMAADQGLLVSGGTLRHLVVPDGNMTVIGQNVTGSRDQAANFRGGVKVGFMTDQMKATQLHITVSAQATGASGVGLRVLLKNWKSGEFESVGTGSLSTNQHLFDFTDIPAAPYRREDGRIEMITRGEAQVPLGSSRVAFGLDQVRIRAK